MKFILVLLSLVIAILMATACSSTGTSPPTDNKTIAGFDEFGYNDQARIFNGSADGVDRNLDGKVWGDPTYANDHLVMKWTSGWDRGNDENWASPPYYDAWENNEWNGANGGSGEVWHYKIVWIGSPANSTNANWRDGGYGIWGQFEVIMDQGSSANEHFWYTHANSTGYGGPH